MAGEVVEAGVGVLRQPQAGEQARRLFGLGRVTVPVGAAEVHLGIGGVDEGELSGQSFAEEVADDLAGIVDRRQGEARELEPSGGGRVTDASADGAPFLELLLAEFRIGAGALHLPLDRPVEPFHRLNHCVQHNSGSLRFGPSRRSLAGRSIRQEREQLVHAGVAVLLGARGNDPRAMAVGAGALADLDHRRPRPRPV